MIARLARLQGAMSASRIILGPEAASGCGPGVGSSGKQRCGSATRVPGRRAMVIIENNIDDDELADSA